MNDKFAILMHLGQYVNSKKLTFLSICVFSLYFVVGLFIVKDYGMTGDEVPEYVYFNIVGQQVAEKNFPIDYWEISFTDLMRYALANDNIQNIKFSGANEF